MRSSLMRSRRAVFPDAVEADAPVAKSVRHAFLMGVLASQIAGKPQLPC